MNEDLTQLNMDAVNESGGKFILRFVAVLIPAILVAAFLAFGVYFFIKQMFPQYASVAAISLYVNDQSADVHQVEAFAQRVRSEEMQESISRNLMTVRPEWFTTQTVDGISYWLAGHLQVRVRSDTQQLELQLNASPPVEVQTMLEATVLTLEQQLAGEPTKIIVDDSPTPALLIAPQPIPLVPILLILFMPIYPGLFLLIRHWTSQSQT